VPVADAATGEPPLPEPRVRIDPSLGLLVLELRDTGGTTHTIPSARELAAYRAGARATPR
jgi:hypothetical protein